MSGFGHAKSGELDAAKLALKEGTSAIGSGQPTQAGPRLVAAIEIAQSTLGQSHFHVANAMKYLGQTLDRSGQLESAAEWYNNAVKQFRELRTTRVIAQKIEECTVLLNQLVGR